MRYFTTLDTITVDSESGVLYLTTDDPSAGQARVGVRREGVYVSISASYGPLEIALRPRSEDLNRLLARLHPIEGLQTTLQAGTAEAYLAIGIRTDGSLVMRPTLVADATGLLVFNLVLAPHISKTFMEWLGVESNAG